MKQFAIAAGSDIQANRTDRLQNSRQNSDIKLIVCMLASGSKGNAIYISDNSTSILVDSGLSGVEIERRLKSRGLNPSELDAILVTHEHADHIHGVGILSRRFSLPVYISRKTGMGIPAKTGYIRDMVNFECGSTFMLKTLIIHPFSISHDAADPAGFTITQNGVKIGIATDLGIATSMSIEHLKGCSLLILEANHDPDMLINGPYPWPIKQRIKSRTGHLSNEDSKKLIMKVKHANLKQIILAHLSEINNTPKKALSVVREAINPSETEIDVAMQDQCGKLFCLR